MSLWKDRLKPQLDKIFDKDGKKAAAATFVKAFPKDEHHKQIEEKKSDLHSQVLKVYEASPPEIKALVKDPKLGKIKKSSNSAGIKKFLEELAKIDFPGAKPVSEAVDKSGPALVAQPVLFLFEKVATFIPKETPKAAEPAAEVAEAETREVVVAETEKTEEATVVAAAAEEVVKVEEPEKAAEPSTSKPVEEPEKK